MSCVYILERLGEGWLSTLRDPHVQDCQCPIFFLCTLQVPSYSRARGGRGFPICPAQTGAHIVRTPHASRGVFPASSSFVPFDNATGHTGVSVPRGGRTSYGLRCRLPRIVHRRLMVCPCSPPSKRDALISTASHPLIYLQEAASDAWPRQL